MTERKYSISEIDAMREALEWSFCPAFSYSMVDKIKWVEERLRTYMIAGVEPQDLIDSCHEKMERNSR